ncbi:hypothetical protein KR018_003818, partial [Drosophila ironensis]
MFERRRKLQARPLEPLVSQAENTTTMRRTRRVCVNIEANGSGQSARSRKRRRREFSNPFAMAYPWMLNTLMPFHSWSCNWNPNGIYDPTNFINRASPNYFCDGDFYQGPTADDDIGGIALPQDPAKTQTSNNDSEQTVNELKDILSGLETHLKTENLYTEYSQERPEGIPEPESAVDKQNTLNTQVLQTANMLRDIIERLSQPTLYQQPKVDSMVPRNFQFPPAMMPAFQVLQLPVQPLFIPASGPLNPHELEPETVSPKKSPERLQYPRERKRKRPSKIASNVHQVNRGCDTDDLVNLPKILEALSSFKINGTLSDGRCCVKDASTTMWCPMECCRQFSGTQENQHPVREMHTIPEPGIIEHDNSAPPSDKSPSPMTSPFPGKSTPPAREPPLLRAPPPSELSSEDDIEWVDQEKLYQPPGHSIYLTGSPATSDYQTTRNYRNMGGNLTYSYIEEEEEEVPNELLDDNVWCSRFRKLSDLQAEHKYYLQKEMRKRYHMQRDKQLQADLEFSDDSTSEIIATSDKAVSTTNLGDINYANVEPGDIVSICQRSSMKRPQGSRSRSPRAKVRFQKSSQAESARMRSIGTDPMRAKLRSSSTSKRPDMEIRTHKSRVGSPKRRSTSSDS